MDVENKICKNCEQFLQHYIKFKGKYKTVYCGHCIHPRVKSRKPDDKACNHYK